MGMFTMNHNYKIPKQPTGDDISIYLPFYDIELESRKTDLPTKKDIRIYQEKSIIGTLSLDERDSTLISEEFLLRNHLRGNNNVIILLKKFEELKKSNINYGNIGINPDTENGYEYPGSEYLTVEIFFNYLKSENREEIIKSITK